MTELLYLTDSYLREFPATVVSAGESGVVLDRSAFYPGGGGQPADRGELRAEGGAVYAVTGTRRDNGRFALQIEGASQPAAGERVVGLIDWPRRYALMRAHTAMHMLSAVIWRDYGAKVTGGAMEPGSGRLDFELSGMDKQKVAEIEARVNHEVAAAHAVAVGILPREQAMRMPDLIRTKVNLLPERILSIRVVHIEDLDLQADGGTHVANTEEVGAVRVVKYKSKGKHNKRLYIELEDRPAPS